jgi:hypothetical protein
VFRIWCLKIFTKHQTPNTAETLEYKTIIGYLNKNMAESEYSGFRVPGFGGPWDCSQHALAIPRGYRVKLPYSCC